MDTTCTAIEYRELKQYPGYRVGSDGTVWTCWVPNRGPNASGYSMDYGRWRKLKPAQKKKYGKQTGYLFVHIKRADGAKKTPLVHRLILEEFVGPCPPGLECCHSDGNRQNNRVWNLRWATREDNRADAMRHGTILPNGAPALSPEQVLRFKLANELRAKKARKFTDEQVRAMRSEYVPGKVGYLRLSNKYGCAESVMRLIVQNKTYRDVA